MYPQDQNMTEKSPLAKTTQVEYMRALRLIARSDGRSLEEITTKSRARVVKAAVRWGVGEYISSEITSAALLPDISLALERLGGKDRAIAVVDAIAVGGLKRRVGRVKKLNGLEPGWALRLVMATKGESAIEHAAVVALFHTGCRISELHGILLCRIKDHIGIAIKGTKQKKQAGQSLRRVIFPIEGTLEKLAALCPEERTFFCPFEFLKTRRVERVIEKASQLTQGSPRRINSSCLRNNVASLAKAAGWEPSKIAGFLGHQSETTQQYYGRAVKGQGARRDGWVEPIKVTASTSTRPAMSKPFDLNSIEIVQDVPR